MNSDWSEYQRLVLSELERHNSLLTQLDEKVDGIKVEIARLQVKSGVWGSLAGLAAVGLVLGLKYVL